MPANWRTKGWRRDTWRRLYVREQGSFASLPFFARATAAMLLKLCDEAGRIEVGKSGDLVEAIAFRMGAERGERRLLRKVVPMLFNEGYLEAEDGGQTVRIRNFEEAQGRSRSEHDASTTGAQPDHCGITTGSLPCNEDQVKPAESLKTTAVIEERREEKKREEKEVAPAGDPVPLFPERRSGEERRKVVRADGPLDSMLTTLYGMWTEVYGVRPIPHAGHRRNLAALFRSLSSKDEITHIPVWFAAYLADPEDYYARQKHPIELFLSKVDRWRAPPKKPAGGVTLSRHSQQIQTAAQEFLRLHATKEAKT